MIEPTESESKADLDHLVEVLKTIAREAKEKPDMIQQSPQFYKRKRLDEVIAAKKPCFAG